MAYVIPEFELVYVDSEDKLQPALDRLYSLQVQSWGMDTEGTGLDPHTAVIRLLQFANQEIAFVFDCFKVKNALSKCAEYLDSIKGKVTLIWQNLAYDLKMLWSA